ncbi:U-box domain-containing protein 7-like [Beta vulgaris subsp. vulgaris]|uniref:U-box domain-containing protein 7-like n=1 Tax=Beta vulgaris subsp. vulgaris TaxID=3555 RepID=UPI002036F502|nr:U-box domain-containing protein 7-like [Beta vulgaris subsp. vulgaris]XP_057248739.1 U-box domain-containing protein 7-like [Beta vulgaris subsp. vulgaris]
MSLLIMNLSHWATHKLQLHGGLCKILSKIFCKVLNIFPALEAAPPRSRSRIQALCSLHVALEKAINLLQHCSECSKLYLCKLDSFIPFETICLEGYS